MDRFVSQFTNRLDAKGRVSIPASFRAVLARDGHEGLYVYPSLHAEALDCGGNALLQEIDALVAPLPPYSEERDALEIALYGESEILKVDGEGRVILTETMKRHTGITTEATFVGGGHSKFQIWEPSRFQAQREEAKSACATFGNGSGPELRRRKRRSNPWSTGLMSGRGAGVDLAAGGPIRHHPVLRVEAIASLDVRGGATYLDGTFGAGGYSAAILSTPGARVVALDRDPSAIAAGAALASSEPRLTLVESRFGALDAVADRLGLPPLDGVVLDIGVSSMQFDEAGRGFSFRFDGPLDMRMGGDGPTAADLVNGLPEQDLADVLYRYGDERASRRIARAIVHDRKITPFGSTKVLADMIARVVPGKPGDIHPATRSFQALRIAVNDELGELHDALEAAERRLAPGGVLAVVTFHSLEDRIVKRFLQGRSGRGDAGSRHLPGVAARAEPSFALVGRQPAVPMPEEVAANPRARSAKLRTARRTAAPARAPDPVARAAVTVPLRGL